MPKSNASDEAKLNYLKGKKAFEIGKFDDALIELNKAFDFYKNSSENVVLADIFRIFGAIFFNKGNMIESRNNYKKAYAAFKNFNQTIGMADCYEQIALSFLLQNEFTHAEEYQQKANKIRESTSDKKGLARGLKNLAIIIYKKDSKSELALKYLEEATDLAKKGKDPQLLINILLDKAKILNKLSNFDEAMDSVVIARRLSKQYSIKLPEDHEEEFGNLLLNMGMKYYDNGNLEESLKYLKNALLIFKTKNGQLVNTVELLMKKIEQLIEKKA